MDKEQKLEQMLKSSSKVVGSKQVLKGLSDGTVRCVIVALDADSDLRKKIVARASDKNVEVVKTSSKRKLGELAGVEVDAAAVGLISMNA